MQSHGSLALMKLPHGDEAIVEQDKLTGYCLDPDHPRGKHKARVFATVLGFTVENADRLRDALRTAAATEEATPSQSDRFGARYIIDFPVTGPNGTATLRNTWIIRQGEAVPRLTSCYVK